jgi:hypothetical protein
VLVSGELFVEGTPDEVAPIAREAVYPARAIEVDLLALDRLSAGYGGGRSVGDPRVAERQRGRVAGRNGWARRR